MKFITGTIKKLFLIAVCVVMVLGLGGCNLSTIPNGYKEYKNAVKGISIEDKVNEVKSRPDYVNISDVSSYFTDAIVAIEDNRFYKHNGLDLISLTRAIIKNAKADKVVEGGSTITQQLAKNLYFDADQNIQRKIAELFVAHKLESMYSKEEILELYINVIYFGNGYYGIEQASKGFFNKNPKDLTLNEASLLAGLPQAPSSYNPVEHMNKAKSRQKQVLAAMVKYKYITQDQANKILK